MFVFTLGAETERMPAIAAMPHAPRITFTAVCTAVGSLVFLPSSWLLGIQGFEVRVINATLRAVDASLVHIGFGSSRIGSTSRLLMHYHKALRRGRAFRAALARVRMPCSELGPQARALAGYHWGDGERRM